MSEWISVEERLPAIVLYMAGAGVSDPVLIAYEPNFPVDLGCYGLDEADEGWSVIRGGMVDGVTHWMPLPPPPEAAP